MTVPPLSFALAFAATLAAMGWLAFSGRFRARSSGDFALAGRSAGSWSVAGAITGTLVGGASTVGTAQLAFLYGFSAWWFTLGAGLACLLLGLFLATPLRESGTATLPEFIARYHGERARTVSALFSALGMFVHIVAQLLAAGALLSSLFAFPLGRTVAGAAVLVAVVVLAGGMKGAGPFGLAKLFLLYLTMVGAGLLALHLCGGWGALREAFPSFPWFSLFGYGKTSGVNDLLSMLAGVVSTQTYLQAVSSARDAKAARRGALVSAVLIPPLGFFGITVGLTMRLLHPEIESVQALPAFLHWHFPPAVAGASFAALLIAAVGTAAGLTLGAATTVRVDLLAGRFVGAVSDLFLYRVISIAVLGAALSLVLTRLGSAVIEWSFLSMGVRGATFALPLLAAVFLGERTPARGGALSIFFAPAAVLVAGISGVEAPPLLLGLGVSFALFAAGFALERKNSP